MALIKEDKAMQLEQKQQDCEAKDEKKWKKSMDNADEREQVRSESSSK